MINNDMDGVQNLCFLMIKGDCTSQYIADYRVQYGNPINQPVEWNERGILNTANDYVWRCPKGRVPPNGWFKRENPIKTDDLGVPPFQETSI